MRLIKDLVTAIAVVTANLVPLKVHYVTIDTNQNSNQYQCHLSSEQLEDKANNKILNYANFFHKSIVFNIKKTGIVATFAPQNNKGKKLELEQLASTLGYERFAWVNYVEQDPHGIRDRNGNMVQTPYNDPPAGGYEYEPADKHPFYWDIEKCDNCRSRHHYQHPKITSKFKLVFEDHPSDYRLQSGESVNFVTHLVGVKAYNLATTNKPQWEVLSTFRWQLTNSALGRGKVSLIDDHLNPQELPLSLLMQMQADGNSDILQTPIADAIRCWLPTLASWHS